MIPRISILVALAALYAGGTAKGEDSLPFDKLIALEGKEFVAAAEESSSWMYGNDQLYTVDQLIALSEKLLPSIRPSGERPDDYSMNPFGSFFAAACEKANDKQLDKLLALYRRLEPNTFEKSYMLPALAGRILAREVARMPAQHLQWPDDEGITVPARLEPASKELQDAWRTFQRAQVAFNKAFPESKKERSETIEVSANERSFYNLISDVLSGATGKEEEVRAFGWTGANCLNITDTEDAQDMALLLMLLHEGRMNEAIGAALRVAGTTGSTSKPEACAKPVTELLERCGLDWEEIFAGGQLEEEMKGWGETRKPPYLAALVQYASPRAASFIRALAHFTKPENREPYVAAFSGWIQKTAKSARCVDTEISQELGITGSDFRVVKKMPVEVQIAALHDVEEFATSDSPEDLAQHAINVFFRTQAPSSIPALKALAQHRSRAIAIDAATILCMMGETVKLPAAAGPVRFQILVNGKTLPQGLEIGWMMAGGQNMRSSATVLSDGVVELPREHFTLRDRPITTLKFTLNSFTEGAAIFETRVSPPWRFDDLTKIDVKVSSLEIVLRNREGLNGPPPDNAFVGLSCVMDDSSKGEPSEVFSHSQTGSSLFRQENQVIATPSVRLPAVGAGKYYLYIGVPGAEIWRDTVVVGPNPSRIEATLKPASDLRFKIITPDGQRTTWASLLKDGREIEPQRDSRDNTYRALPCGNYTLRIPPSDFFERQRPELKTKRGPDEIPWKARDVAFKVEKGSPTLIDLGEIRLERAD